MSPAQQGSPSFTGVGLLTVLTPPQDMLDEIGSYLVGLGLVSWSTLFLGKFADSPDDAVALYEYQGSAGVWGMGTTAPALYRPNLQVVCRSGAYDSARQTAKVIGRALAKVREIKILGTFYELIDPIQSEPFHMGQDPNDLALIAQNFEVWKAGSPV